MRKEIKKRCYFLTGATGLVGSYLLTILLKKGHKTFVLARNKNSESARKRILAVLNFWDPTYKTKEIKNLVVLEGEIKDKNLGLKNPVLNTLAKEIDEVYHSAAITEINWPLDKIRQPNVEGTRQLLDLCVDLSDKGKLAKINHISTVYVCGNYKGIFREQDLNVGQQFNTTYEQSKYEAENLVHAYRDKGLWIDIFRPPLITGESTTGKITNFRNVYQFLSICRLELFDKLPVANCYVNIAPVDYVAQSIYMVSRAGIKRNSTYHTFPNFCISIEKILDEASKILNFKKPKVVTIDKFDVWKLTPAQQLLLNKTIYSFNTRASLSSLYTSKLLSNYGLKVDHFGDVLFNKMLKYFKTRT